MKCPREAAQYLSTLILYDIAILIDDSLSMLTEQEGKRIEDLKKTLKLVAHIYRLYNDDGIKAVDFLNDEVGEVNVAEEDVDEIFKNHSYRGLTRIGTELQQKVLNESVLATDKEMFKPLLILIFTDGDVEGEKSGHLKWVIKDCIKELNQKYPEHGAHAVAFQFARVGDDAGAEKLLRGLDDDKDIGKYVDTLPVGIDHMSNEEFKWPMVYISHWLGLQYVLALKPSKLTKLLLGAILIL
ncbi:Similar to hypothetical protein [Tuber melanosporum Mel28]; acc. no. XP_002835368 [Pyronema omphalodes CBS 100304]|uniref:VWFA domain-containing protein n=1 Tax=Pyronema omphalodes (strain CBS 100304) TaxID=1076935 RepID=U4L9B6_PYROM|nr:Similar to hypothetical protein [Tuber melanosporum Mel28]; acc. no. XP_002835368 [Pyronema omphalodes CBS 100304]